MKSWTRQLSMQSLKSNLQSSGAEFNLFHINYWIPSTLLEFEAHVSILGAGNSPHEPHTHPEEELIIILSGKLQIIRLTQTQKITRSTPLGLGSITYHDSNRAHTVYNVGSEPAIYICIKWTGKKTKEKSDVQKSSDFVPKYLKEENMLHSKFETKLVFESITDFLGKLHCHMTCMKAGAGYKPHTDSYDVMIILLDGKIETLQKQLKSNSVIFYHAGEPHGLKNVGSKFARYLVFEFHGNDYIFSTRLHIRRILKLISKKIIPRKIIALLSQSFHDFCDNHKY